MQPPARPPTARPDALPFGVHFQLPCGPGQSPTQRYRDTIEQSVVAEALGFESVWPVEQHFDGAGSIMPAPLLLLAAIAERTTSLRLGTGVVLLPLWHPLRVAEEFAVLDVLSGGRVECGVGRGMDPGHFQAFAADQRESAGRLEEGIEILRQAWTSETLSFDGTFHRLNEVTLEPRPVQAPHPPIRVAANSVDTLRMAGRLGLPILVAGHINPLPALPAMLDVYRDARHEAGHTTESDDITLLVPLYVGRDRAHVQADVEPGLRRILGVAERKLRTWLAAAEADPTATALQARLREIAARFRSFSFDDYADTMAVFDGPERCAERLVALRDDLGLGRIVGWFNPGGLLPHRRVVETMELFAGEVMPHVSGSMEASRAA